MMTASAYHVISKEVEKRIFRHNRTFRHTFMYQQPTLTSSGIITFLCKYYIVISDTLISSWMSFFFFSLAVNQEEKIELQKKYIEEFV